MVAHRKALTTELVSFIMSNVVGHRTAFEVSDVKRDGTVFVKFRSYMNWAGADLAAEFNRALWKDGKLFTQTSDVQFRLRLDQFGKGVNLAS